MADERIRETIIFPVAICGYPKLNPTNPPLQGQPPNERKRWSIDLYFNPDEPAVKKVQRKIAGCVEAFEELHEYEPTKSPVFKKVTQWANKAKTRKTLPRLLGMLQISLGENAETKDGTLKTAPALMGPGKEPIPHGDIYPGCHVIVVGLLDEYTLFGKNNSLTAHGLSFHLKAVQFVKDGERIGGDTTDYTQFLEAVDDEDDDEGFSL